MNGELHIEFIVILGILEKTYFVYIKLNNSYMYGIAWNPYLQSKFLTEAVS